MRSDRSVKCLLLVIALLLGVIAVRPYVAPPAVSAQSAEPSPFFIEPGVTMLRAPDASRQVLGKVMIGYGMHPRDAGRHHLGSGRLQIIRGFTGEI